jgi:hypothetical protein
MIDRRLTNVTMSSGPSEGPSLHKTVENIAREHTLLRGSIGALQAYLSSLSSPPDGGSVLVSIVDGCCGEGSSDNPADDRKKVSGVFGVTTGNDAAIASSALRQCTHRSRRGDTTHHVWRAWSPSLAASSRRSGKGRQELDLQAWSILPMRLLLLFLSGPRESQPGPTATQDAPPHITPIWDEPPYRAANGIAALRANAKTQRHAQTGPGRVILAHLVFK